MRYEYKEIVNSAIHTYLHGETELEFKVKDYIHEVYEKAELYDQNKEKIEAWDKLNEYVSTTPYDSIDMDTLKNRLNKFMDETSEYDAKKMRRGM